MNWNLVANILPIAFKHACSFASKHLFLSEILLKVFYTSYISSYNFTVDRGEGGGAFSKKKNTEDCFLHIRNDRTPIAGLLIILKQYLLNMFLACVKTKSEWKCHLLF